VLRGNGGRGGIGRKLHGVKPLEEKLNVTMELRASSHVGKKSLGARCAFQKRSVLLPALLRDAEAARWPFAAIVR